MNIQHFETLDSTNSYAKLILETQQNLHKTVIIADTQTAGRGRLNRTFVSPAKTGLYMSIIYTHKSGITNPAKITAFTGVAVCRVLKHLYNLHANLKWVNDVYLNGKKIAGILTEGVINTQTGLIETAIIGIGINITKNPEAFSTEVQNVAGSIFDDINNCAEKIRDELSTHIINEVFSILDDIFTADKNEKSQKTEKKLLTEYKELSFLLGSTITVHPIIGDDKSSYSAKAIDISPDANLIVQLADGNTKTLNSGEVSLHSSAFTSEPKTL